MNQPLRQLSLFDDLPTRRARHTPARRAPEASGCVRQPVSQWNMEDRPAERLLRRGPSAVSDAELLSCFFSRGVRQATGTLLTTVDMSRALLREHGSLYKLSRREALRATRVPGIGRRLAARLAAAFEIARRIEAQRSRKGADRVQVTAPGDVAKIYGPLMRDLKKEIFKVVLLNTANVITGDYTISAGGLAASIVEPRAVFRKAILENAAAVICLHNHPSGNPEPSREDISITRQLIEAGKLMGIPLHDHLIIAGASYTSLAERGVV